MKTTELIGPALDWAVAKCEEVVVHKTLVPHQGQVCLVMTNLNNRRWHPSTNWSQGGPIIEREGITHGPNTRPVLSEGNFQFKALPLMPEGDTHYGPTPLIAAMRCYVASKLGDEVAIPEELL